jgi:hypothetical protein
MRDYHDWNEFLVWLTGSTDGRWSPSPGIDAHMERISVLQPVAGMDTAVDVRFARGEQSASGDANEALAVAVKNRRVQMAVCQV